jgi:pimeloyl-ACP methyl ester carboxylesterase
MGLLDPAVSRRVDAGGLDVRYWEVGDGPPVVLLHGGIATAEVSWRAAIDVLAPHHRLLMPDSRGHGDTPNPAGTLGYDQMADDVAAFIAALGLDRPAVAGHSDGGQIALELGLRHPGIAGALVLSGTVSRPTPSYLDGLHAWGFPAPGEVDVDHLAGTWGDGWDRTRSWHAHGADLATWTAYLRQISHLWLTVPDYTDARLAGITDPTLAITGDADDMADVAQAERFFRTIPGAKLGIVPCAGHGVADEAIFWHLVRRFLDDVAGRRAG